MPERFKVASKGTPRIKVTTHDIESNVICYKKEPNSKVTISKYAKEISALFSEKGSKTGIFTNNSYKTVLNMDKLVNAIKA